MAQNWPEVDPGELRTQIEIWEDTSDGEDVDSFGQPIPSWESVATVWALVRELPQKAAKTKEAEIHLRYYEGLATTQRFLVGETYYEILSIQDIDSRNIRQVCLCKSTSAGFLQQDRQA